MVGFHSGYLDGLQRLSGLKQQEVQSQMQQMALLQAAQEQAQQQQVAGLMGRLFDAEQSINAKYGVQSTTADLARLYQNAGQQLMSVNPKTGMELLREAVGFQQKTDELQYRNLQVEQAKMGYLGEVAGQISDQETLNSALQTFASQGVLIPSRFHTWNPQTAAYFQRKAIGSVGVAKQMELGLRTQQAEAAAKKEKLQEERLAAKELREESQEVRAREAHETKMKGAKLREQRLSKPWTEDQILGEMQVLTGQNELFDKLDVGAKRKAVEAVRLRAAENYRDNAADDGYTEEMAMEEARRSVLAELKATPGILGTSIMSGAQRGSPQIKFLGFE